MQNRIMDCRLALVMTQAELGKKIGLMDNTIARYENGTRVPSLEVWEDLASALHVSPAYLVGWSDDPSDGAYHYDFAGLYKRLTNESGLPRRIPIGGTKITLDNGRVIYSQRSVGDTCRTVRISAGDWLIIDGCHIAVDHIASIEEAKVEED